MDMIKAYLSRKFKLDTLFMETELLLVSEVCKADGLSSAFVAARPSRII